MKTLFGFSIVTLILMWILLAVVCSVALWHAYHFCKHITLVQEHLPRIFPVRALLDAPPQSSTKTADGVLIKKGDLVLVWPHDMLSHHPAVWRFDRKGWTYTDELRRLVPGSIVQVKEGLQFAHTAFAVRTSDSIVPLWQHWLLTSRVISDLHHRSENQGTFVLLSDDQSRLNPTPMSDILPNKDVLAGTV